MIVLLCNDDGIAAEGLAALRRASARVFPEARLLTVAPAGPMSQVGHRVTTTEPLQVEQHGEHAWAVHGTPADCIRVALAHLLDQRPAWVLSGINHGGNLGQDIYISGTVAAAREAAYHGVPAASFSHYLRRGLDVRWDDAERWVGDLMAQLREEPIAPGEHWNVNLPHLSEPHQQPPVIEAAPERRPLPIAFRTGPQGLQYHGVYAERLRETGSDVDVCFGGAISRTKLRI